MKRFKPDYYEVRIIILTLNELRNQIIQEGKYTNEMDKTLIKLFAKSKDS